MSFLTREITAQIGTLYPNQAFVEMNRPFRFSDSDRVAAIGCIGTDALIRSSQLGEHRREIIEYIEHALTSQNKLSIIEAAMLLQNLTWHNGPHLLEVVRLASTLLDNHSRPLIARENAAAALKNSAWYPGKHILMAVDIALRNGIRNPHGSDRITNDCVRVLLYISSHSRGLLQNDAVRKFLEVADIDTNPTIASNAQKALAAISRY